MYVEGGGGGGSTAAVNFAHNIIVYPTDTKKNGDDK